MQTTTPSPGISAESRSRKSHASGPEQRKVHHQGVDAHGDELLDPRGCLEPAVGPAEPLEPVDENPHESGVGIEDREPDRSCIGGVHLGAAYGTDSREDAPVYRFFTGGSRAHNGLFRRAWQL